MRFALLGNDPDGVEMACALAESGRHEWVAYTKAAGEEEFIHRGAGRPRRIADAEEILADPSVELVIVAGPLEVRPVQLQRAVQSERHVLCAYPPDRTPAAAYVVAMMQENSDFLLLPLLPRGLHPGVVRLANLLSGSAGGVGPLVVLEVELSTPGEILAGLDEAGHKATFPGWDLLRALGGEIEEVSAFAEAEELRAGQAVLLSGRFARGGLFQVTLLPGQPSPRACITAVGRAGRAELFWLQGWDGPAFLGWSIPGEESREEAWDRWDPWPAMVEVVEAAVAGRPASSPEHRHAVQEGPPAPRPEGRDLPLSWQDAVQGLELDDAARRSVERRRASALEHPEPTEETGFKGAMTLVGCSLFWVVLLLLILWNWWPPARYLIPPVLILFLALQLLRYLIPQRRAPGPGDAAAPGPGHREGRLRTGPPSSPSGSGPPRPTA
jgi:predicted dehydrogenase